MQNFIIGVWYRGLEGLKDNETTQANRDAVVLVIGGVLEGSRISYSYDISTSRFNYEGVLKMSQLILLTVILAL